MRKVHANPQETRCPAAQSAMKEQEMWCVTWGVGTDTFKPDSYDFFSLNITTSMRGQHSKASRTQFSASIGTGWSTLELTESTNKCIVLPSMRLLLSEKVSSLRLRSQTKERNRRILTKLRCSTERSYALLVDPSDLYVNLLQRSGNEKTFAKN